MKFLIAGTIGLVSGVISGLCGVGGGIIMVPAMVFLLKLDTKIAIGTSLAVIIPTAISGTVKHYNQGNVDLKIAALLIPTAILGAWLGAQFAESLPQATLKRVFGGLLLLVGVKMLIGK